MSLRAEEVTVGYAIDVPILTNVSINITPGRTTAIIGPNGAGKSTLLKTLCGLLKPIMGRIFLGDREITHLPPREILKLGISYIPQDNLLFPKLSVEHNLKIAAKVLGIPDKVTESRLAEILRQFPSLERKMKQQAGDLSGGLQKMVSIARTIITDSRILLFDEPTAGLSPIIALEIYDKIVSLKEQGKTIVLVDHNLREAMDVSDYVYVLNAGKVTHQGSVADLRGSLDSIVQSWLRVS